MKKFWLIPLFSLIFMLILVSPVLAEDITLFSDTDSIDIDMTFAGGKVTINGQAPTGSDIYVKFTSPEIAFNLSKMGKKAVVWMPVENIVVEDTPGMFQVLTSAPIDDLSSGLQATMGIDTNYSSVLSKAKVLRQGDSPVQLTGVRAEEYLNGLVGIMQEEGLFAIDEGGIARENNSYRATLIVPPNIPRGISTIEVYAVRSGEIIASTEKTIVADSIGIVQLIGHTATNSPFLYGILAVGVALAAGFMISVVFRDKTDTDARN